jgi:hypothetical protein
MKKLLSIFAILAVLFTVAACKTTGSSASTIDKELSDVEAAFQKVYEAYQKDLILDGAKSYTVKSGDSLAKIARDQYGANNGFYYPLIMLASSDVILDPDLIEPGIELTVPDLQKNLDNAKSRGNLKAFLKDVAKINGDRGRNADRDGLIKLSDSL